MTTTARRLHVGVILPEDPVRSARSARLAERLGFDSVGVGEHIMFHGPTTHALTTLAHLAGVTERVRLLSAVTVVPLYPVGLLAKLAANVDLLSAGRLVLGVGVGGEYPTEFDACGVPLRERGRRADESLAAMLDLWKGPAVDFSGSFTSFTAGRIDPRPAQPGGPPIWVSGRSDAAMRRAARFGRAWMPYLYGPEQVRSSGDRVRSLATGLGRDPGAIDTVPCCFVRVEADGRRARRLATRRVSSHYRQDFSALADRYLVAGTPSECLDRLGEYVEAGAAGVVLIPAVDPSEFDDALARIADELLPGLHARALVA